MIAAYNHSQSIRGMFSILGSMVCFALAWLLFRHGSERLLRVLDLDPTWAPWIAGLVLAGICVSGHATWKRGEGFRSYEESAIYHHLVGAPLTAVPGVADHHAHKVAGPAYVLGQILLGAPLLLLRGITHLKQRLPEEAGLEAKLRHTLGILRAANKWQSITEHPGHQREILLLAQMKQIDFSAHKGIPRIKASPPDGI